MGTVVDVTTGFFCLKRQATFSFENRVMQKMEKESSHSDSALLGLGTDIMGAVVDGCVDSGSLLTNYAQVVANAIGIL